MIHFINIFTHHETNHFKMVNPTTVIVSVPSSTLINYYQSNQVMVEDLEDYFEHTNQHTM